MRWLPLRPGRAAISPVLVPLLLALLAAWTPAHGQYLNGPGSSGFARNPSGGYVWPSYPSSVTPGVVPGTSPYARNPSGGYAWPSLPSYISPGGLFPNYGYPGTGYGMGYPGTGYGMGYPGTGYGMGYPGFGSGMGYSGFGSGMGYSGYSSGYGGLTFP